MASTIAKVIQTKIKFFDAESQSVKTLNKVGIPSVSECKAIVRELHPDNIYVDKTKWSQTVRVDSEKLLSIAYEV